MPIRILIADDHAIVAEGLKHLVEAQSDLQVVATVGDGRAAVRMAKETAPGSPEVVMLHTPPILMADVSDPAGGPAGSNGHKTNGASA